MDALRFISTSTLPTITGPTIRFDFDGRQRNSDVCRPAAQPSAISKISWRTAAGDLHQNIKDLWKKYSH